MNNDNQIKKIKIGVVGVNSQHLKNALNKRGYQIVVLPITHFPSFKKIKGIDLIYGAYFQSAWPWFVIAKLRGKKTICHWVGSDSVLAIKNKMRIIQTKIISKFIDIHLAVSERIKNELSEIGIESDILFHGSDIEVEEIPFPDQFGSLIYFIEGREQLYGVDRVVEISKLFPNSQFYFVGNFNINKYKSKFEQKNLHFLGYINLKDLWPKINVVIRMTQHDGFPKIILEAFAKGRYAIHNYPLPGVILCETNEDVIEELRNLREVNVINSQGIKLFNEKFRFDIFLDAFSKIYNQHFK